MAHSKKNTEQLTKPIARRRIAGMRKTQQKTWMGRRLQERRCITEKEDVT